MEIINSLLGGFQMMLHPLPVFWVLVGAMTGTLLGALPGMGPSTGVAVLMPLSFALPPAQGLSLLISIYLGAMYGGRISSILINTPGDAAAIMTCVDGYPLTTKGKAGVALGVGGISSFIGGFIGIIFMTFFTPALASVAVAFGPPEMFAIMIFSLIAISVATDSTSIKGISMVVFGLLLATIGTEHVQGKSRFTFGIPYMLDGIDFVPAAIGMFGITEVMIGMEKSLKERVLQFSVKIKNLFPSLADLKRITKPTILGSILGTIVGVLPGAGATLASFVAYGAAKKTSKYPEEFGKGAIEGVAAPESANNACAAGALSPMMALGIPGSAVAAMIMGGFIIHDLQPGPMLFIKTADVAWAIIAGLYIANFLLIIINLALIPAFVSLIRVSQPVLFPVVGVLCVIGVFSINQSLFDVIVMLVFGIIGFFCRRAKYPVAGLLLALILGDKIEQTFRQSLIMSQGSYGIFVMKPVALGFLIVTLLCIIYPLFNSYKKYKKKQGQAPIKTS